MLPSSSSGWAVVWRRRAVVRNRGNICARAEAPRSCAGMSWASTAPLSTNKIASRRTVGFEDDRILTPGELRSIKKMSEVGGKSRKSGLRRIAHGAEDDMVVAPLLAAL